MLVVVFVSAIVSISVSFLFVLGIQPQIDRLKKEIDILRAIIDHK